MKKGSALIVIAIVVLVLLVVGLWLYPNFTKDAVTGAVTKVKKLIP
jgi:flagellar basal body-associated protein FliL